MTHVYRWKNNPIRKRLFGKPCSIIRRGSMNSVLVEFEGGEKAVVSRWAVRKETKEGK